MPVAAPDPPRAGPGRTLLAALLTLALLPPALLVGVAARLAWNLGTAGLGPDAAGPLLRSVPPGLLHGLVAGGLAAFLAGRFWRRAPHRAASRIAAAVVAALGGLAGATGALEEALSFGVADVASLVVGVAAGLLLAAPRPG